MLKKLVKGLAPVAAIALSATVAGCGDMNIEINGEEGVPLAELDMSGEPPNELVLAGPDQVVLTEGDTLDINVEGDSEAVDLVRFSNKDGTLAVSRANGKWSDVGTAIVRVTMPAPKTIVIAGSGKVEASAMADDADITIAGSGRADVSGLSASKLEVTIAGSGSMSAAGTAERMELNIVGSGKSEMAGLSVDDAEVTVAGSGDAEFASDGTVEANIVGSGNVTVNGNATCEISSMGSGTLKCQTVETAE
ncbi:head GIN domain-containing protein [Altererythrobacter ishigakiensis]|uniref:Putative autotransporter adhesin-like protein n=1 Tax=Altererythrobacter ishigakiensis TaxID=476157 RepID=A0A562UST3_9SPHN|nr:head GIN domain-containing protein [Altererythrobacter ishigakiensis]TWJ08669.1 putative autotransporter adhesin-like protein [Altererythrobacter ishigakiensis]